MANKSPLIAHKVLAEDYLGQVAGTALYPLQVYDYGTSRDDATGLGETCTSWSLDPSGGYPFVCVPDRLAVAP